MSGWKVGDKCEVQLFSRGRVVGVVCEARGSEWRIADTQANDWAWSCLCAPDEMRRPGQAEAERDELRARFVELHDEVVLEASLDRKGRAYTSACVREWCASRIEATLREATDAD